MKLIYLEEASENEVQTWFLENFPDLTPNQKRILTSRDNFLFYSPFYFMRKKKKTDNVLLRFTIIFIPIILLILFLSLPFNYFITGRWGYSHKILGWFLHWLYLCNF